MSDVYDWNTFSVDPDCPKCNKNDKLDVTYIPEQEEWINKEQARYTISGQLVSDIAAYPEYLEIECRHCGYEWHTACYQKDAIWPVIVFGTIFVASVLGGILLLVLTLF